MQKMRSAIQGAGSSTHPLRTQSVFRNKYRLSKSKAPSIFFEAENNRISLHVPVDFRLLRPLLHQSEPTAIEQNSSPVLSTQSSGSICPGMWLQYFVDFPCQPNGQLECPS